MAVYVDDIEMTYKSRTGRTYKLSHMIADSMDELQDMALNKLGLRLEWFQDKSFPHYDVTITKKKLAVKHGAIKLTTREMVKKMQQLRKTEEYSHA